jgi:hypothetical protein
MTIAISERNPTLLKNPFSLSNGSAIEEFHHF